MIQGIEHYGSTSVDGLPAKPILDILIGVLPLENWIHCRSPLENLGYGYAEGARGPGHFIFRRGRDRSERTHLVHVFAYSLDNYADHLGIGHLRFEKYMPDTARALEQAEKEGWSDERLAEVVEVEVGAVQEWRKLYRDAVEIVDAPSPAMAFRNAVDSRSPESCSAAATSAGRCRDRDRGDANLLSGSRPVLFNRSKAREAVGLSDYSQELRRADDSDTGEDQENQHRVRSLL